MPVKLRKLVFLHQIRAVVHLQKKINIGPDCSSVFFDWSIIMIGPGGLLLVVPRYMQFQLLVRLPKQKQLNLDI